MNLGSLSFSGIVDMGFVLLVSAACLRSLGTQTIDGEKIAAKWRTELRELERVLRELITEAGTASSTLDRRLVKRKVELEALLKRADTEQLASKSAKPSIIKSRVKSDEGWELGEVQSMPNASWLSTAAPSKNRKVEVDVEDEPTETEDQDYGLDSFEDEQDEEQSAQTESLGSLELLLADAEDQVELSAAATRRAPTAKPLAKPVPRAAAAPAPKAGSSASAMAPVANSLSSQIELIKTQQEEDETFKKLAITDPTAYRIARRLLAAGTEIHIVARKLDIPIAEVRMLDRLMREEGSNAPVEVAIGPNYKPTEVVPRSKIVRDRVEAAAAKSAAESAERRRAAAPIASRVEVQRTAVKRPVVEDIRIEDAIEREMALL